MKKRMLSLVLVLALALSLAVPAFAATYTDIQNHWAKTYLQTLADKGILNGYSGGTMKPDNNITAAEALVLLSRLYTLSDAEKALIADDYASEVTASVPSSYAWAYGNFEICRAAGIITKDELKALSLDTALKKEELAVFIIRAMGYSDTASTLTVKDMSFADAAKVSKNCIGSVAELAKLGILTGDTNKNVSPQSSVTRAVVATMVVRALDVLQKAGTSTLTVTAYSGISRAEGIITAVGSAAITFTGFDGLSRDYAVPAAANIKLNGTAVALSSALTGCHAILSMKNGSVKALAVDRDAATVWYQGTLTSIVTSGAGALTLTDTLSNSSKTVALASTTTLTLDGVTAAVSKFAAGNFVTVKAVSGTAAAVTALTAASSVSGEITAISFGSTITLKLRDDSAANYSFTLDFSSLPTVKRGEKNISIDMLTAGDRVTLSFAAGKVSKIAFAGSSSTVTGELTSVTTTPDGTRWTVTANGTSTVYVLDEDAAVYSGTTAISLSSIRVGDQLKLTVFGNIVTDVWQLTAVTSATKVSGSVLKIDASAKQITILTPANKLVYISTASVGSYVVASTGSTGSIANVTLNAQITAYGTFSNSRSFAAKSIVIE